MHKGVTVDMQMNRSLQNAIKRSTPRTLLEAGRYVWRIARSLVHHKADPNMSSNPGTPPYSHQGSNNPGFKRTIQYALTPDRKNVVIGPKLVRAGLSNIARNHEFGGGRMVNVVDPQLMEGVKIGNTAPVTQKYCTKKDTIVRRDPNPDPQTMDTVVWIIIRNKSQARHSTRLYRRMVKNYPEKVYVNYPARPYMRPALNFARPKLTQFWKNSVRP